MSVDDSNQALVGYRSNEEWQDLLAQAATMVGSLEEIEDQATPVSYTHLTLPTKVTV